VRALSPARLGVAPQMIGVLLIVGLAGAMAIQPTRQLLAQRERIESMNSDLQSLQNSNSRLRTRIDKLNDPDFIEQQARAQIGLARPGETAFVVMPPSARARERKQELRAAKAPPPPPEEPGFLDSLLHFITG
jgi:cell division protein FtsB